MKSNCLVIFGGCFLIYLIIDWFFSDAFLYLIGGAIGSTTKGIFNTSNPILVFLIWVILLAIFIFIYNRFSPSRVLDVIFILIIALLLNIVDALVYELMSIKGEWSGYLHLGISVLAKSLLLSWVICSKQGWLKSLL
jgi:hypothetical protein